MRLLTVYLDNKLLNQAGMQEVENTKTFKNF